MAEQIQINNDDVETVELSTAEYEAIVGFSAKIAEQNALVLQSIETLRSEMVANAENMAAMFASLVDAIRGIQVNVNPQFDTPAPVINIPPGPAPKVTVQTPPETPKKVNVKFNRDRDGRISSASGTIEER